MTIPRAGSFSGLNKFSRRAKQTVSPQLRGEVPRKQSGTQARLARFVVLLSKSRARHCPLKTSDFPQPASPELQRGEREKSDSRSFCSLSPAAAGEPCPLVPQLREAFQNPMPRPRDFLGKCFFNNSPRLHILVFY